MKNRKTDEKENGPPPHQTGVHQFDTRGITLKVQLPGGPKGENKHTFTGKGWAENPPRASFDESGIGDNVGWEFLGGLMVPAKRRIQ